MPADRPLSPRAQRFVDLLIADPTLSHTEAARRAGYSERRAGVRAAELMRDSRVREQIEERRRDLRQKADVDAEWVVSRLQTIVERCMQAEPVLDRRGHHAVTETPDGGLAHAYRFDSAGANKALELLGRHLGLFPTKIEGELRHVVYEDALREVLGENGGGTDGGDED